MKQKTCQKCKEKKPVSDFPLDGRFKKRKVYRAICAACSLPAAEPDVADKKVTVGVPWQQDPAILLRLHQVSVMMLEKARPHQIMRALGVSWDTVKRDMQRVMELWRDDIVDPNGKRIRAIRQLEYVQEQAYANLYKTEDVSKKKDLLKVIIDAQKEINLLEGTHAPKQVQVTAIPLPLEAQLALEALEKLGVNPHDLYAEFTSFVIDLAAQKQQQVLILDQAGD